MTRPRKPAGFLLPDWIPMMWPFTRRASQEAVEAKSLAYPDMHGFGVFGVIGSANGVAVTAETALRCTPVRQAVSLIGGSIASLPVRFIRRGTGGAMTELGLDYRPAALMARPNAWTGKTRLWRDVIADAVLTGNGYALAIRVRGEVRELHRLPPHAVGVEQIGTTSEPQYRVSLANDQSRVYPARDIIHLRDLPSADGTRGAGLVHHASEAIGLALVMEQHAAGLFGSGARPAGALKFAKALTPSMLERLKLSFASTYAGGANAGRTLVLEEGVTWEALALKSTDAQFLELRSFAISEIARAANLSPILLGETSKATFANSEQAAQNLLSFSLTPWNEQLEDELERVLLPAGDIGKVTVEVDYSSFAVADLEKRTAAAAKRIETGLGSIDEERAAIMRGPVPGGSAFMTSVQSRPLGTPATKPAE
jgi:HK97 family phage portal protein